MRTVWGGKTASGQAGKQASRQANKPASGLPTGQVDLENGVFALFGRPFRAASPIPPWSVHVVDGSMARPDQPPATTAVGSPTQEEEQRVLAWASQSEAAEGGDRGHMWLYSSPLAGPGGWALIRRAADDTTWLGCDGELICCAPALGISSKRDTLFLALGRRGSC
ncbi:hypothetical protein BD289DRAFT_454894 [Coniella lustricola]|uniref:Uncharacterized protein n=1 Tax=Coniella lustricola TaxID=2025994 RepID=A0A2T3A1T6_9PEZI|nr:hypothetical protein BD289DRAFT_454894 [Coniella lustricola]